jgi:hypothetical protein
MARLTAAASSLTASIRISLSKRALTAFTMVGKSALLPQFHSNRAKSMKLAKLLSLSITLCMAALTLGFAMLWYERAQLPYGSSGQYFDAASGVTYSDGSVLGYAALAMACCIGTALSIWRLIRVWRG